MTEFLISGRGTGKTAEAVKWVRGAGNRYLVVADTTRALSALASDTALRARQGAGTPLHQDKVIPYSSIRQGRHMGQTLELAVDDLDLLLQQIFMRPVGFITATGSLTSFRPPALNQITIGGS